MTTTTVQDLEKKIATADTLEKKESYITQYLLSTLNQNVSTLLDFKFLVKLLGDYGNNTTISKLIGEVITVKATIQVLPSVLNDISSCRSRTSVLISSAIILTKHGAAVKSITTDLISSTSKLVRKETDQTVKYYSLWALTKMISANKSLVGELLLKDLIKFTKQSIVDKSTTIRSVSAMLLLTLFKISKPSTELDQMAALIHKAFDNSDSTLTSSLCDLYSGVLIAMLTDSKSIPITEPLALLKSQYLKHGREYRIFIVKVYCRVLSSLPTSYLEQYHSQIVKCIFELSPRLPAESIQNITTIFAHITAKFSDNAKVNNIKELISILSSIPNSNDLEIASILYHGATLIDSLGTLVSPISSDIVEPVMRLISPATPLLSSAIAYYFQSLMLSTPKLFSMIIDRLLSLIQKEIPNLTPETSPRFENYIKVLVTILQVWHKKQLYIDFQVGKKCLGIATSLLKSIDKPNAQICQIKSGWSLITGLFSLSPEFVRIHLSQIMLLWKKVFGKPDKLEKSGMDWLNWFIAKESALFALMDFLKWNKSLITSDVAKRCVVMLNNLVLSVTSLPVTYPVISTPAGPPNATSTTTQAGTSASTGSLFEHDQTLRYLIFKCYLLLDPSLYENNQLTIIRMCCDAFAPDFEKWMERGGSNVLVPEWSDRGLTCGVGGGDKLTNVAVDASMVTSLITGCKITIAEEIESEERGVGKIVQDEDAFDVLLLKAHYTSPTFKSALPSLQPSITLIDTAITLFSILFPLLSPSTQDTYLEIFLKQYQYDGGKISAGKKEAVKRNILVALVGVLKYCGAKKGSLGAKGVESVRKISEEILYSSNPTLRLLACELVGRLSRFSSPFASAFLAAQTQSIINNRSPNDRSGASLSLGYIHSYTGSLTTTKHLSTTVGILHSLITDPNASVQLHSLQSLYLVVESSGLMYLEFTTSTIGIIMKLWKSERTEIKPWLIRILNSLVGVLGPEVYTSKVREVIESLLDITRLEICVEGSDSDGSWERTKEEGVKVETGLTLSGVPTNLALHFKRIGDSRSIGDNDRMVKVMTQLLYQVSLRNPDKLGAQISDVEKRLFNVLDEMEDPACLGEVQDILKRIMTHDLNIGKWVGLVAWVLSGNSDVVAANTPTSVLPPLTPTASAGNFTSTKAPEKKKEDQPDYIEDDSEPVNISAVKSDPSSIPKWRTQVFAVKLIRELIRECSVSGVKRHFNLESGPKGGKEFLVDRLNELVKLAFSAATNVVDDVRFEGLGLLMDVLEKFKNSTDPDFEGHALLEQYQAQISAALTPAFSVEASPEVTAAACRVCAVYVCSGINKDYTTLGRVLKLLSGLLEKYKSTEKDDNSPHIQTMLRIAILQAWAELFLASLKITYLKDIVQPHLATLASLWIVLLKDYAKIRIDWEISTSTSLGAGNPTSDTYSIAIREVLMPFYKTTWQIIIRAFTSLIEHHAPLYISILRQDSKTFNILFGLCVEAVSNLRERSINLKSGGYNNAIGGGGNMFVGNLLSARKEDEIIFETCLESIRQLVRPQVLGGKFLEKSIFIELLNVFDRVIQTEDIPVQCITVAIVHQIVLDFGEELMFPTSEKSIFDYTEETWPDESANAGGPPVKIDEPLKKQQSESSSESLLTGIDNARLQSTLKLLFNVFTYYVPGLSNNPTSRVTSNKAMSDEIAKLLIITLETLSNVMLIPKVKERYFDIIFPVVFSLYLCILETEKFSHHLGPRVLVLLKKNLDSIENLDPVNQKSFGVVLQSGVSELLDSLNSESDTWGIAQPAEYDTTWMKNILLSVVLIISGTPIVSYNPENQERLCDILKRLLRSPTSQLAMMSLQCIRSLLLLSNRTEPTVSSIGSQYLNTLVPHVVVFIVQTSKVLLKIPTVEPGQAATIDEGLKVLLLLYTAVGTEEKKTSLLAFIVPVFILMLSEPATSTSTQIYFASPIAKALHNFSTQTLFQLATERPQMFKKAINGLPHDKGAKLENAFKIMMAEKAAASSGGFAGHESGQGVGGVQPKIQLKNFSMV